MSNELHGLIAASPECTRTNVRAAAQLYWWRGVPGDYLSSKERRPYRIYLCSFTILPSEDGRYNGMSWNCAPLVNENRHTVQKPKPERMSRSERPPKLSSVSVVVYVRLLRESNPAILRLIAANLPANNLCNVRSRLVVPSSKRFGPSRG
jgi:hypothetical protein